LIFKQKNYKNIYRKEVTCTTCTSIKKIKINITK